MTKHEREAIVAELARQLEAAGSWSGATHMQKCAFFLQEKYEVGLGYDFVIHRYGPFSFDLDSDLVSFRRRDVLTTVPGQEYGVHYRPGTGAPLLPANLREQGEAIVEVAREFGTMRVEDLEVHATTFFVSKKLGEVSPTEVIEQVQRMKPHIPARSIQLALERLER